MLKKFWSQGAFAFIIITTFLGVMGIGVVIPVIPFIVTKYFASGDSNAVAFSVGMLMAIYSICQFFAAPVLGALSDKYGRRPVLLLCQLGSAIGYIMFGAGGALWILYLGRVIDGLTGGDISTIFAYVADITPPQERGQKFGILGATVGVGFILGPSLGGLASKISLSAPFYIAAGLTLLNMAFGYFVLPESLKGEHKADFSWHHLNPFATLLVVMKRPVIRSLLIIGLFYFFPFAILQSIGGVYLKDVLNFTPVYIGLMFLAVGVFDIITQGYLSGKLIPKFGEVKMVVAGLALVGFSYALSASQIFFHSFPLVFVGTTIYALGSGFFEPAFGALVSHTASPQEQGKVQGANQSVQAITRIVGPLFAAALYPIGWNYPYISCIILSVIGALLMLTTKIPHVSQQYS